MKLIDTHAHLDEIEDIRGALDRAKEKGVKAIVGVGSSLDSNKKILMLATQYPGYVFPALGLHPWRLEGEDPEQSLSFIEENIDICVALGEVGLDFAIQTPRDRQEEIFRRLLIVASRANKPVLLHARRAWAEAFDMLKACGIQSAIFHWFSGPTDVLKNILAAGYFISVTPAAVYSERHRQALQEAPVSRIFLETDAPEIYRGKASEPRDLVTSLQALSELKGLETEEIADLIWGNTLKFFKLKLES
jgi:TatD DNase family protein